MLFMKIMATSTIVAIASVLMCLFSTSKKWKVFWATLVVLFSATLVIGGLIGIWIL